MVRSQSGRKHPSSLFENQTATNGRGFDYDPLGTAQGVPGPKRWSSIASSPQATPIARKDKISMTV